MPYSSKQVTGNAYHLVFNTGVFVAACLEWNKRAAGDKTLPHPKVFFAIAHREWRLLFHNKMGATYGVAHNAAINPDDGYIHQYTVDAITNLTKVMVSYPTTIAQLTVTIARLTKNIAAMNKKLVVSLHAKCASRVSRGGCDRVTRRCRTIFGYGAEVGAVAVAGVGAGARARSHTPAEMAGGMDLEPPIHYC